MMDKAEWLNFRWALDVEYCHKDLVPILTAQVERYDLFWDGTYCYQQQNTFILRWPDWRDQYRVDLESWKRHHKIKDKGQLELF